MAAPSKRPGPGEGTEPPCVPVGTDCASVDDARPAVERLAVHAPTAGSAWTWKGQP